jgi:hypothetical protein
VPIEPPISLADRLEKRLTEHVDAAAEELADWELGAMRDPRNWVPTIAAGLVLAAAGGTLVVQDPGDALVPSMPASAIAAASADHVVPAAALGELLNRLARVPVAVSGGEAALWSAREVLEERSELMRRALSMSVCAPAPIGDEVEEAAR